MSIELIVPTNDLNVGTDESCSYLLMGVEIQDNAVRYPGDFIDMPNDTIYSDVNNIFPSKSTPKIFDIGSVYQSVLNILSTLKKTRFFLPEFGADLEVLLFEPIDDVTSYQILTFITTAVQRWDPRVRVRTDLSQVIPYPEKNFYDVQLYFEVKGLTGQVFNVQKVLRQE